MPKSPEAALRTAHGVRDQIDEWLGGEVTPLNAPPGSLHQIRRRARQRKTRQAVFAAAGCAVVLGAAVAVPQFVSGGSPGGANPPIAGAPSPQTLRPSAAPRTPGTAAPDVKSSTQILQRTKLSTTSSGTLPPLNFQPTSVTIVGAGGGLVGAVIGQAGTPGHCFTKNCTSLAGTSDYGASWYGVSAPLAPGPNGSAGVSQLRFASEAMAGPSVRGCTRPAMAAGPGNQRTPAVSESSMSRPRTAMPTRSLPRALAPGSTTPRVAPASRCTPQSRAARLGRPWPCRPATRR